MPSTLKVPNRTITLTDRVGSVISEGRQNTWLAKAVWSGLALDGKSATFSPPFVPDQWILRFEHIVDGGEDSAVLSYIFLDEDDQEWASPATEVEDSSGDDDPGDTTIGVDAKATVEIEDAHFPSLKVTLAVASEHASRALTVRVKARAKGREFVEVTPDSNFSANSVSVA